ncbi:MAG: cyclase family protein [Chthoniobacteraceae bacterium]
MRIFDLSQPVFDGCPNCPAHPSPQAPVTADHPADGWRMEMLHLASHTGTHLDAPLHKLAEGKAIDAFPLEAFLGPVAIADLTWVPAGHSITAEDLARALPPLESHEPRIVLLNTGWGLKRAKTEEWLYHSPFLSPEGAEWLVTQKVKGVGIDHFSIGGTRDPDNTKTHEILLGAQIWIIEELCFREGWQSAAEGALFQALPLYLPGFSGAPVRAVLLQI